MSGKVDKMKVQYMSDLHLEFGNMQIPEVIGDVLVLAGDIGVGIKHKDWVLECCDVFPHVVYVLGNHEFYGHNMQSVRRDWADVSVENLYVLDNSSMIIGDTNFIGTTLWSKAHPNCPLNDFRLIKYKYPGGYGKFSTLEANLLHIKAKRFIKASLMANKKNVVVTHHSPSWKAQDPQYGGEGDVVGSGFNTNILEEFPGVSLWIYGHTHYNTEFNEHSTYVVTNQRGYTGYGHAPGFDPNKYVEV